MLNIGPQELLVILVIALVVVGPQRLPELGRSIGRWVRELRKAQDEVKRTIRVGLDEVNGEQLASDAGNASVSRSAEPPPPTVRDPTPTAGQTPSADEVREISRSLGRSLGQLRKAREDVQRSFRVDMRSPSAPSTPKPGPPIRNSSPSDASAPPDGYPPAHDQPASHPPGTGDADASEG